MIGATEKEGKMIGRTVRTALTLCVVCGWLAPAEAAPVGSRLAEQGHWSTGGEMNFMLDRDMDGGAEAESNQFLGTAMYGVTDRISALVKLGAADLEETGVPDFDESFAYGLGIRVKLAELEGWELIASPQYFSIVEPDTEIGTADVDGSWHEWQGSLVVARSFPIHPPDYASEDGRPVRPEMWLRPYAGLKVSGVQADRDVTFPSGVLVETDLDADDHVGLVGGVEAGLGRWALGIEGRAIDEEAITLAASVDF